MNVLLAHSAGSDGRESVRTGGIRQFRNVLKSGNIMLCLDLSHKSCVYLLLSVSVLWTVVARFS